MRARLLYFVFVAATVLAFPSALAKTIADFESSAFFKRQSLVEKDAFVGPDETLNMYSFKDTENPRSPFDLVVVTKAQKIVEIQVQWEGKSKSEPARLTPQRTKTIKAIAEFWGISEHTNALVQYAESQQQKRYEGYAEAPRQAP